MTSERPKRRDFLSLIFIAKTKIFTILKKAWLSVRQYTVELRYFEVPREMEKSSK